MDDGTRSQLYNMADDPHEWDNLYGKPGYSAVVQTLKAQIDSMVQIGQRIKTDFLGAASVINFIYKQKLRRPWHSLCTTIIPIPSIP